MSVLSAAGQKLYRHRHIGSAWRRQPAPTVRTRMHACSSMKLSRFWHHDHDDDNAGVVVQIERLSPPRRPAPAGRKLRPAPRARRGRARRKHPPVILRVRYRRRAGRRRQHMQLALTGERMTWCRAWEATRTARCRGRHKVGHLHGRGQRQ